MKSDKLILAFLVAIIFSFMFIWGFFVIKATVGLNSALDILNGEGKVQIESFGQFGASFGLLAALFAGIAVVMLRHSISVQQKELTQLKEQMEHDRIIREFSWLIDVFQSARNRITQYMKSSTYDRMRRLSDKFPDKPNDTSVRAEVYIYDVSDRYLKVRAFKKLKSENDIQEFMDFHLHDAASSESELVPFDTYISAIKQTAIFIKRSPYSYRNTFLSMIASVTTTSDLIIIHEQALLREDHGLIGILESTGLLGVHGSDLYDVMAGGPRLKPSAFGKI